MEGRDMRKESIHMEGRDMRKESIHMEGRDVQKELIHKMKVAFEGRDARESVELVHGEEEDGESGSRRVVKMNDPAMPSEEEKRDHEMTHLPYRSLCRHCIRGRGKEMGHRKSKEQPEGIEIHMDLCFPGGEEGPDKMTVLVARERRTRMTLATALPSKSSGTFVAKRGFHEGNRVRAGRCDDKIRSGTGHEGDHQRNWPSSSSGWWRSYDGGIESGWPEPKQWSGRKSHWICCGADASVERRIRGQIGRVDRGEASSDGMDR